MPVYKIKVEQRMELTGEANIWAPSEKYIRENEDEILEGAETFIDLDEDLFEFGIHAIQPSDVELKDLKKDCIFGEVPQEPEKPKDVPALPGQLKLLEEN